MEEMELIARCQAGDGLAFEELLAGYERLIYNLTFRYFGNHHDASDVSQEAMLRIYRKIGEFNGKSSFKTWLYRVVTNLCLDEIRRRKHAIASIDDIKEKGYEPSDSEPGPVESYEKVEQSALVQEVLALLTPEHRAILILKDIEGLDYQEIAVALGCSLGTVKSRLNRARESFRKKLSERPQYQDLFQGRLEA